MSVNKLENKLIYVISQLHQGTDGATWSATRHILSTINILKDLPEGKARIIRSLKTDLDHTDKPEYKASLASAIWDLEH